MMEGSCRPVLVDCQPTAVFFSPAKAMVLASPLAPVASYSIQCSICLLIVAIDALAAETN